MQARPPAGSSAAVGAGFALGMIGMIIFGVTMPMTRLAVTELDPLFVTVGRALEAAACAVVVLVVTRSALPPRETWPRFAVFATMVVLVFPLCMGVALLYAPASHGGVVLALQPLLTALASMVVAGERPSAPFFAASLAGTATVVTYAVTASAGSSDLHWADLLLALAAVAGSIGYAIGGQLSRRMPGWLVISWAVVFAAPVMALLLIVLGRSINWQASTAAWSGFVYVGLFSMYLGFFAWNSGLALGGIAKVGQLQLLQPFVTLVSAALLLGETLGWREIVFSSLVVAFVAIASRLRVRQTA